MGWGPLAQQPCMETSGYKQWMDGDMIPVKKSHPKRIWFQRGWCCFWILQGVNGGVAFANEVALISTELFGDPDRKHISLQPGITKPQQGITNIWQRDSFCVCWLMCLLCVGIKYINPQDQREQSPGNFLSFTFTVKIF